MSKPFAKITRYLLGPALLTLVISISTPAFGKDEETVSRSGKLTKPKPYVLSTCLVSDQKLGSMGAPYIHIHKDREIKFCCKGCLKDFNKQTAKHISKLEEAEKKAVKAYALSTCLVTDEQLGSMGEPFVHIHQDREIKFCCKACLRSFNKEPASYIRKLDLAEKSAYKK
jgi:transposase-like protein